MTAGEDGRRVAPDAVEIVSVSGFRGAPGAADPFGPADAPAIRRRWDDARRTKPEMFDGVVLLGVDAFVASGRLAARYAEVRFSAFDWWRDAGEGRDLRNVFGAGIVMSADGAALLGRMAPHTAPAGQLYFPCGTPDRDDVRDGLVDLDGSIAREIQEETGLREPEIAATDDRFAIFAPKVAAYVRRYSSRLDAAALSKRIEAHLSRELRPELDAVRFVKSVGDLTPASPDYVHLALGRVFGG